LLACLRADPEDTRPWRWRAAEDEVIREAAGCWPRAGKHADRLSI
jgi:hypothetical protein